MYLRVFFFFIVVVINILISLFIKWYNLYFLKNTIRKIHGTTTVHKHGLTKHVLHIHAWINYNSDSDVHVIRTIHRLELKTHHPYIYIYPAAFNFWEKSRILIKPNLNEWGHGAFPCALKFEHPIELLKSFLWRKGIVEKCGDPTNLTLKL